MKIYRTLSLINNTQKMKHLKSLFLFLFTLFISSAWSQTFEITPSYGYQFGSKLEYGRNYIQFDDSDQFGLVIAYELDSGLMGELTYIHHSSQLNIRDAIISPRENRLSDLNADWVMIGASKYFKTDKVKPFAGLGLGFVFLSPKNENYTLINSSLSNETKFTFSFKAGANMMISEVVGINLQFNMLLPIEWGGVYVGGGSGGVSGGVSASGSTLIAGFSGGLVFRLGDKSE